MPYISPENVAKAKQLDLYTYLRNYEPHELVHFGGNTYCTREHDSLKISNGKWYWFSRNIGGRSALDYLIKVRGMPFTTAVERILDQRAVQPEIPVRKKEPQRTLILPEASSTNAHVTNYLIGRGIDSELIAYCIQTGRLFESKQYHNAVFVGKDMAGTPRYVNLRGIGTDFKGEASGSDKRYSFNLPAERHSDTLHLFESAIDLLSYATVCKQEGVDWRADHLLSLAGVYRPRKELTESSLPLALKQYLKDHPGIHHIVLRLDNDYAGRTAASAIQTMLANRYDVTVRSPPSGKDYNDYLCIRLGKPVTTNIERRSHNER